MNLQTRINFEWDPDKERINIQKHRIDFTTAARVFDDLNRIVKYDEKHSINEDRYIVTGIAKDYLLIVTVAYTVRLEKFRIISARPATKEERKEYIYGLS